MLQYLITALAGVVAGIVGLRIWQSRGADAPVAEGAGNDAGEGTALAPSPLSTRNLLVGAGVLAAAGAAILLLRPQDDGAGTAASPLAATGTAAAAAPAGAIADVDTMIARLEERLRRNPRDAEGFRMLGWSYVMTGKPGRAIEPYKRALALEPGRAAIHSGYGEALVAIAGNNTVTPEARAAFDKALAIDPTEPRARYFVALAMAANGQGKQALDALVALANAGPADAPWQAAVRREATKLGGKLDIDAAALFKQPAAAIPAATAAMGPPALDDATMRAAGQLPEGQRQAMVDDMVEGLARKLQANPGNADGWVMLLRSRMVLKQADKARDDLAAARKALAGDAAGRQKVEAAARDLAIPGA